MVPYSRKRTSEPAVEPVTVSELKDHLGLTGTEQDVRLSALIAAGRRAVERDTGLSLITQTWQLVCDGSFPADGIELLHGPVQSVSSVQYVDADGNTSTVATSVYDVDTASNPGVIRLAYGQTWPTVRGDDRGITVTYVTGYGDTIDDVPQELREAVKLAAQLHYDSPVAQLVNAYERVVAANRVGVYP